MVKIKRQNYYIFFLLVTMGILLMLSEACTKKPPQISDIKLKPEIIRAGGSAEATVDILSNPSALGLKFEWSTNNGTIEQGLPAVKYQPQSAGNASISLNVKNSKNDKIIVTKTLSFSVESPVPVWDVLANCVFAGWMGDGEKFGERAITLNDKCTENPQSPPSCVRITYRILPGSMGYAGIYAQYNVKEEGVNWGKLPGKDLSNGYTKLIFYARGEKGGEMVEFKAGGINKLEFKDSFEGSMKEGTIKLEREWMRYEMDLSEVGLSSVIGAFCWVATVRSNPNGATFYIDSVTYE